jgi:GntR family transcriptional regulator
MSLARMAEMMSTPEGAKRLPKYIRLSHVLLDGIGSGYWKPGQRLPSESELADSLPASLGTVQKALGVLAERGVVVRKHGKGTFVVDQRVDTVFLWQYRFLDDDGELLPVYFKTHSIDRVTGEAPWESFLGPDEFYVRIARTIDVNHEFTVANIFVLPGKRFASLLGRKPSALDGTSLRIILSEEFNVPTLRISEQILCHALPDEVCTTLDLPAGTVGLTRHVFGYGYWDAPVSYQCICTPPNSRLLEIKEKKP